MDYGSIYLSSMLDGFFPASARHSSRHLIFSSMVFDANETHHPHSVNRSQIILELRNPSTLIRPTVTMPQRSRPINTSRDSDRGSISPPAVSHPGGLTVGGIRIGNPVYTGEIPTFEEAKDMQARQAAEEAAQEE